jgi:hypothetical protein
MAFGVMAIQSNPKALMGVPLNPWGLMGVPSNRKALAAPSIQKELLEDLRRSIGAEGFALCAQSALEKLAEDSSCLSAPPNVWLLLRLASVSSSPPPVRAVLSGGTSSWLLQVLPQVDPT